MIEQRSKVFLGGPPLVKMATGEESDDESLGGAEMHARVSGLADYFAVDELDALRLGRQIVRRLNRRKLGPAPRGAGRPAALRPRGAARHPVGRPARRRSTRARCSPASSTAATSTSSSRSTAPRWSPAGPSCTATRSASSPTTRRAVQRGGAEGGAVHPARQPDRHAAAVPAEHHRLHGRQGLRAARHHQGRRQDDQRRLQHPRAAPHGQHGVATAPATTACAAGRTTRGSCSPGPTPRPR